MKSLKAGSNFTLKKGIFCPNDGEGLKMLIDKFKKNALEEVRTEITKYKGERYLNIRVWYDASDNG